MPFLPICKEDLEERGWEYVDVVVVSADAYVDHPSFGHAVVSRLFEHEGLRVAILPQPNWRDDLRDFKKLGKPRLFFAVSSGMDSMVNHYTANKRLRHDDAFTSGGRAGFRPDYAVYVYTKILKTLYPETPVIIGGLESSLRRIAHYDYWQNKIKPSILFETGADLLVYGMGEKPLKEIVRLCKKGVPIANMNSVPQTAFITSKGKIPKNKIWEDLYLSSFEDCVKDKQVQFKNFRLFETETNKMYGKRIIQDTENSSIVVNPPYPPFAYGELDESFEYPYMRAPHPRYKKRGPIPAFEMIKFSINTHRGCFGGCNFCALAFHQGRSVRSRSIESVVSEAKLLTERKDFKGDINDVGGPTANFRHPACEKQLKSGVCADKKCLAPEPCKNLKADHSEYIELLSEIEKLPKCESFKPFKDYEGLWTTIFVKPLAWVIIQIGKILNRRNRNEQTIIIPNLRGKHSVFHH